MWQRSWQYLKKAGTIILGLSIILWVLTTYPRRRTFERDYAGESALAEDSLLAGVKTLNAALGLAADSDALLGVARAEILMEADSPMAGDVAQLPAQIARTSVLNAARYLAGNDVPPTTYVDVIPVDKDNAAQVFEELGY